MRHLTFAASLAALILISIVSVSFAISLQLSASRLSAAPVKYVQHSSLQQYSVPVVAWRRAGLAEGNGEIEEIETRIIYPTLLESKKPVAAVVVEFAQTDRRSITVIMLWADGETREALISKNDKGRYDGNAYKVFFENPVP